MDNVPDINISKFLASAFNKLNTDPGISLYHLVLAINILKYILKI